MAPCFNISHVIDEHSPLHGKSLQDMQARLGRPCWVRSYIFTSVAVKLLYLFNVDLPRAADTMLLQRSSPPASGYPASLQRSR